MSSFRLISFSRSQIVHCQNRFYKTSSSFNLHSSQKESYRILGLSESADEKEIKQAYFQLAKKYHPDRNKGDKNAQIKFQELTNAYERLTNKNKNTDEEFDFSQRRNSKHSGFSEEYSKEYYDNHRKQQREATNGIIIRLLQFYYRFREIIWIGSSVGLLLIFRYTLQRQENINDRLRRQYGLNSNHVPQNDHVRKINPKKMKTVKKTIENSDKEKNVSYNQSWYK